MSENGQVKLKKQPERQCMGCNIKKAKKDLIRIVKTPEGKVELDFTGKKAGRCAYLCHDAACLKKIRKSGRISRIFETAITDEVWTALEEELSLDN